MISSSILGTYWPGEFPVQYPIILLFHTVHGVFKARILKWFAIPFFSGPHSLWQTSPPWPAHLRWPHMAWLSFSELDKAVVCVIRLTSFMWLWFQRVCPLMSLATPTVLLGFVLPWTWGISSQLFQQRAAAGPYLGWGVFPHGHPSWSWMWSSSFWPSCSLYSCPPWTWGYSLEATPRRISQKRDL